MRVLTIILGILLLVSGFYCVMTPVETYSALGWAIGLSMVIDGAASVVTWSTRRSLGLANGWTLAAAIVSIVLGVYLLSSYTLQYTVDLFIAYVIAFWLIFGGISRIVTAIFVRKNFGPEGARGWVGLLVIGILIVIMGVLCVYNPVSVFAGVGFMIGISIITLGVGFLLVAF